MKISVETYGMRKLFGDEEALRVISAAGFEAVDFSFYYGAEDYVMYTDAYGETAKHLRSVMDEAGIVCNQAHAPFSLGYGKEWNCNEPEYRKIVQSLEAAAILGAEQIVVHSIGLPEERRKEEFDYNYQFYKSLEPYAEKYGIRIAVENLFYRDSKRNRIGGRLNTPEELCAMVKALNSPWFTACVDLGHASLTGLTPEAFVAGMEPGVLKCLHVQDTDFRDDRHWLPFQGNFNWPGIMAALRSVDYDGDLTFELTRYLNTLPPELARDALVFAHRVGEHLVNLSEER